MYVSFIYETVCNHGKPLGFTTNLPQVFPREGEYSGQKRRPQGMRPTAFCRWIGDEVILPLRKGELLDPLTETMPYPFEMLLVELEFIPIWTLYVGKGNRWVPVVDIRISYT